MLTLDELTSDDELTATLDCTGGFYSTQRWSGVGLGRLLQKAGVLRSAPVTCRSSRGPATGGASLSTTPTSLLLATHVADQPLSHEHGAPVRLVAPYSRGFQWVKWVERIDVRELPDYGAPASTVWSSFTAAGRGDA